ncbi:MAG: pyridoxal-dependent decarboxylase [Clostridiales bacterium]
MKNNINKFLSYFPSDNKVENVETLSKYLSSFANQTKKYVDDNKALLSGQINKYKKLLDAENLPIESACPEEVINQLAIYFQRAVQWEKAQTMINITPPANILSIAGNAYTSMFNPNFAQDEPAGYLLTTELIVVKFLIKLVGWNKDAGGVFTFGGKGTNLYAGKIGLNKAIPNVRNVGVCNYDSIIITNDKAHPCHSEICDWLGIGRESCLKLPTKSNGQIELINFEKVLRKNINEGIKIACIIINGGTTNELIIDPIKKVVDIRDKLVKEFNLEYIPHIHVDSVIGWVYLVYKYYDFKLNRLEMEEIDKVKISSMMNKISELKWADSFGVDFHKTGFCPYVSSCIMVNNNSDLYTLGGKKSHNIDKLEFGEYSPFEWTLELTRGSNGPISAYIAFKLFGISGFQELVYHMFSNGQLIRKILNDENDFDVINDETEGFATLFVILPVNSKLRYNDYLGLNEKRINELLYYNQKFYLFLLKKYEENEIGFRITFSKSYKPHSSPIKTGCLKTYQSSPIANSNDIGKVVKKLILLKKQYDKMSSWEFSEKVIKPSDFVYR